LPIAIFGFTVNVVNGKIYVIVGSTHNGILTTTWGMMKKGS
jgi:hypothetical protein